MRAVPWARKVFDGLCGFGIVAAVVVSLCSPALGQPRPSGGKPGPRNTSEKPAEEDEDVMKFEVRVPRPEAMMFRERAMTRYQGLEPEADFLQYILESAKNPPF